MELQKHLDGIWLIKNNGKQCGVLIDRDDFWEVEINYKRPIPYMKKDLKKGQLKQIITDSINWDAYEVYSEYKARLRGFKIIG